MRPCRRRKPCPIVPGLGHFSHVVSHHSCRCEKAKYCQLRESTEKELFFWELLKPLARPFGMNMSAPHQCQPNIGVKEIQCVHRSVRWLNRLSAHLSR